MKELTYYISVFLRRLPLFLVVASVITAVSVIAARTLPPEYVSAMRLVVEGPRIPKSLAGAVNDTSELQQLQIVEQKLLTRSNLLEIAGATNALTDYDELTPDEIQGEMLSRTRLVKTARRGEAAVMHISFTARDAKAAADVLNEYLTKIRELDVDSRRGRASETLEFFEQEVSRLSENLSEVNARILAFKLENSEALPENLTFRLSQQSNLQERLVQIERDISDANQQKQRLVTLFNSTGETGQLNVVQKSDEELRLEGLKSELVDALSVYSENNPKILVLKARIKSAEDALEANNQITTAEANPDEVEGSITETELLFRVEVQEIEDKIENYTAIRAQIKDQLELLNGTISDTPAMALRLQQLELERENTEDQYNNAIERLATAKTTERIELSARGQKITVIDPPTIPDSPSKPNRLFIAGAGSIFGIGFGFGLIMLLELLDTSVRRPEDLVKSLGIIPISTIPYIRTPRERFVQRSFKVLISLGIIVAAPLAIYLVHTYYLPLDIVVAKLQRLLSF